MAGVGLSAGTVFVDVLPNMAGFQSRLSAGLGGTSLTRQMTSMGKTLTRNLTLPIVGLAAISTKWAVDFQSSMEKIHTQAGASQHEVDRLSKSVLDLARTTSQGPQALADALYHIESVGYRGAKAMGVLKAASEGAAVGGNDLEATASALSAVMVTNIKGTESYGHAMGVLNAAVGSGNMRMEDLTKALSSGIVPTAKVAGLSLQSLMAPLAMLTDEGIPAEQAATKLRTALIMLDAPSKKAQGVLTALGMTGAQIKTASDTTTKALDKIGMTTAKLGEDMRKPDGLMVAMADLKQHVDAITKDPATRVGLIAPLVGGSRSAGTILTLLNNLNRIKLKYDQIGKTASHFNQDVVATQATNAYKLSQAWSNVQATLIRVGGTLAPFITALATGVGALAADFSGLSQNWQKWSLITLGTVAALGPVLTIFGTLGTAATAVGAAIVRLIGILPAFDTAMVGSEGAMIAFGESSTIALGPLGLIAVGIAGIGIAAAGIVGWLSSTSSSTDELAGAAQAATRAVLGLNAALDHSKSAQQAATAAHHQETGALLEAKSAQENVNKLVSEGKKGTQEYKLAVNQTQQAWDNYRTAQQAATQADAKAQEAQHKAAVATANNRDALEKFTQTLRGKVIPAQSTTSKYGRDYSAIQEHNTGLVKDAVPHYEALAAKYGEEAAHLQRTNPVLADTNGKLATQAQAIGMLIGKWGDLQHLGPAYLKAEISFITSSSPGPTSRGYARNEAPAPTPKKKGKATGGPVDAGAPYMIGDGVGPEWFVPNIDGRIYKTRRNADKAAGVGNGPVALVITNWNEGTGYITSLADSSVARGSRLTRQIDRMAR